MSTDDFKRRVRALTAAMERPRPEMQSTRVAAARELAEWLRAPADVQEREIARMEDRT